MRCHLGAPRSRSAPGPVGPDNQRGAPGGGGPAPGGEGPGTRRARSCPRRRGWRLPRARGRTSVGPTRAATDRWPRREHVPGASHRRGAPPGVLRAAHGPAATGPAGRRAGLQGSERGRWPVPPGWGLETRRQGNARSPCGRPVATARACCAGVSPRIWSTPALRFPQCSVTRCTASTVADNAGGRRRCRACPLPPLPIGGACPLRPGSRRTMVGAWGPVLACQSTALWEPAPAGRAVSCLASSRG
jgi:hypothetical protein